MHDAQWSGRVHTHSLGLPKGKKGQNFLGKSIVKVLTLGYSILSY